MEAARNRKTGMSSLALLTCIVVGISHVVMSCAPDTGFNTKADFDVVVTLYDTNVNFGAITTFDLPDSIVHLGDQGSSDDISRAFDRLILDEVKAGLIAAGYTEEPDPGTSTPDVVVLVSAASSEWTAYVSYPGDPYWGWYPYWPPYGPGWGTGYPYYGGVYSYDFTTGSIIIDMIDTGNFSLGDKDARSVWAAGINGVVGDTNASTKARIKSNIAQVFDQSGYLKKSN